MIYLHTVSGIYQHKYVNEHYDTYVQILTLTLSKSYLICNNLYNTYGSNVFGE